MEATAAHTCGPSCAGNGLECAIKHCGVAQVFCEESATRSDPEDCRQRIQSAYDHFSHISDVHLASSHPKLAKRARDIRKDWEPIIFKRGKACPPHGACEQIADFKQELVGALAKFENHEQRQDIVSEPEPFLRQEIGVGLGGSVGRMVSEAVKDVGYIVGGGVAGYVIDNVMTYVNNVAPTMTGLAQPGNIVKLIGGIVAPIYAAYGKASPKTRYFAAGLASYYIPQVIGLARSLTSHPARFTRVIPSGLTPAMPISYAAPSAMRSAIF